MTGSQLAIIFFFCFTGWFLMWADYGLTLVAARPGQAAGLIYELNPFLRADVAARRLLSPRFAAGTTVVFVALLAMGWYAVDGNDYSLLHAVLAGVIATRLYLIAVHLNNLRRRTTPTPTTRQAMLAVAIQQTTLAAAFTLLAVTNVAPPLHAVWVGAAGGFLLMAAATLLWRWREPRPRLVSSRAPFRR